MKRFFAILLAVCLIVTVMPAKVHAAEIVDSGEWGQDGSDVHWELDSNGTMTIFGTGAMTDCYLIDTDSYGKKDWFRGWDNHQQEIKTVIVKEGITYIGDESFSEESNLEKVIIADSVTSIGHHAFARCDSLVDVDLGDGLETLDIEVFIDCDALETLRLPDSLTKCGNGLLAKCDKLESIVLSKNMTVLSGRMFENCVSLESISIPENITDVGGSAFSGCTNLKEITIPESVVKIHSNAFEFCINLKMISLPNSLTAMGNSVFTNCLSLKTITIPVNVTQMAHTFDSAVGLESVKFLGNFPNCGSDLFGGITITAYYPSNNKTWNENARQDYGGHVTWVGYESDIIPSDTLASGTCGDSAYWELQSDYTLVISGTGEMSDYLVQTPWYDYASRIECVIIEPGITKIGTYAFNSCKALTSATIPNTVEEIGQSSFYNCVSLEKLEIPESVTTIYNAFYGCRSLEYVKFLGDAPWMDESAFRDVTTTAYYPLGNATWAEDVLVDYSGNLTWVPYGEVIVTAGNKENGKPTLTWEPIEGVTEYRVYRSTSQNGKYARVFTTTGNSYTHASATAGNSYYYYVKAILSDGSEVDSEVVMNTCTQPAIVFEITTGNKANGKPTLSWEPIDGAAEYRVYRSTSQNGKYAKVFTTKGNSYTHTSATAGNSYYYYVKAILSDGSEVDSEVVMNTCMQPAQVFEITTGNKANGKPTLSWEPVEGAAEYRVYRSTSQNGKYAKVFTTKGNTYTHTSATADNSYYYYVKAILSDGSEVDSEVVMNTCIQPAQTLEITTGNNVDGKPTLSWEPIEGAAEYRVYRSTSQNGKFAKVFTTRGKSYTHASATAGNSYYYYVKAILGDGTEVDSEVVMNTYAVAELTFNITPGNNADGKPTLKWAAVPGVERYEVYRADSIDGNYVRAFSTRGTTYTNTSAKAGNTYYYKLKAYLSDGTTATSDAIPNTCLIITE